VINLSATTGEGVDALRERLRQLAGYEDLGEGAFTARQRHLDALKRALKHFTTGRKVLAESRAGELLAEEFSPIFASANSVGLGAKARVGNRHLGDRAILGNVVANQFCVTQNDEDKIVGVRVNARNDRLNGLAASAGNRGAVIINIRRIESVRL